MSAVSSHKKAKNSFDTQSRQFAYVLITFLIGVILIIEDFTERDANIFSMLGEFILFFSINTVLLLLFSRLFRHNLSWYRSINLWKNWERREVFFLTLWAMLFSGILFVLSTSIASMLPIQDDDPDFFNFHWTVWVAWLIFVSIVIAVELFWDITEKRQRLEVQNERLIRSQEMAKYQALMNQVNPHFLFNSLNVLSYLVYQNPRDAERFIEELSKIYRYILQINEAYVVPLKQEISFIESYIYLQKIRYQNNLSFETQVDAQALQSLIPPLTLEVVVENAIKHNTISEDRPLSIRLFNQNGHLIVENNLQPRMENEVASTKVGLKNLLEKFDILESSPPEFYTQNGKFIAKIPLLKSEL